MQHTTGYLSEEFIVDQVFNYKSDLQKAAKIYSIKTQMSLSLLHPQKNCSFEEKEGRRMSMSMEASCHGYERYLLICYQQI